MMTMITITMRCVESGQLARRWREWCVAVSCHRRGVDAREPPRVILAASTPSTRGSNASMASMERATHLELVARAGEIDFEEFLLVIKNMQNPGAVQSKLGVAVQKGVKKGVFQTTMKGGAKALFEGVAGAAKEIPGARRQNLRHAVDDNRREKLREERAIRRDRSKPHGRQNRAGRTDDVGSALMTSTQRKKRIEQAEAKGKGKGDQGKGGDKGKDGDTGKAKGKGKGGDKGGKGGKGGKGQGKARLASCNRKTSSRLFALSPASDPE